MADIKYTQLTATQRASIVRNRIRDIESQILTLQLRVEAPDLNQPPNEIDQQNLDMLESSLGRLHELEKQFSDEAASAK